MKTDIQLRQERLIENLKGIKMMQYALMKETERIHAEFEDLKVNYDHERFELASKQLDKAKTMGDFIDKRFKAELEEFRHFLFDIYGMDGFKIYDKIISELGLEL